MHVINFVFYIAVITSIVSYNLNHVMKFINKLQLQTINGKLWTGF